MKTLSLAERLSLYARLARLDKPIGTLLLFWPTAWALWLSSDGRPDWTVVLVFAMGTLLMRSAGCVINDYADRNFDGHVERTRERPLASGRLQPREALWLFAGLSLMAFALVLWLNRPLVVALSVPAVLLAASYPFTKRFLSIPQAYLGIAFGFGIPMSYAAHLGSVPAEAWVLLLANIFWAVAYDTAYAMVDRNDDLKIGIKTSAITFGRHEVRAIMLCYLITIVLLGGLGWRHDFGSVYFVGLAVAAAMMLGHYPRLQTRERAACFAVFLANNRVGGVIFLALAAALYVR